jgi:hypothetical protein
LPSSTVRSYGRDVNGGAARQGWRGRIEDFWSEVLRTVALPLLPLVPVLHTRHAIAKPLLGVGPVYILGLGVACRKKWIGNTSIAFGLVSGAAFGFDPDPTVMPGDGVAVIILMALAIAAFVLDWWRYRVVSGES